MKLLEHNQYGFVKYKLQKGCEPNREKIEIIELGDVWTEIKKQLGILHISIADSLRDI